jgi:hypothetical protein
LANIGNLNPAMVRKGENSKIYKCLRISRFAEREREREREREIVKRCLEFQKVENAQILTEYFLGPLSEW